MSRSRHNTYASVRSTSTYDQSGNFWKSTTPTQNMMGHWNPVRSGMGPKSKSRSFRFLRCCVACYNAKIITVEPIIFLFMFAYYFYKVIFELYSFNHFGSKEIAHLNNVSENLTHYNHCLSIDNINNYTGQSDAGDIVETEVGKLTLIVGITARLPSVMMSLLLGPLSDRFGRKPTLFVILLGMLFHAVITIIIVEYGFNVYFFILGGALRGMGGGIAGILTACYSYIADVSSKKWLVVRLGLLEAMTFAAGTLSLVTGGIWAQFNGCNFKPLAWVLLGTMLIALPYTILVLPESLDKEGIKTTERVGKKKPKTVAGPKALLRGLQIFFGRGYPRCKLWLLLLVMVVTILNTTGTIAIITLFLLRKPIQWEPLNIGIYLATSEMIHGLALIVLLPILVYAGIRDDMIALIGIILSLGANLCLGFVDETWQVYTIGAIQSIDALILPGIKAIMSKTVLPADHGALFSFVSAAQVLASVLAYGIYVPVYTATLGVNWSHASGISFFIMALLFALLLPIMMVIVYLEKREKKLANRKTPAPSPPQQSPQHTVTPSINSPPRRPLLASADAHNDLLQKVQSELGQDALERQSLLGSMSLGRSQELERSFQSSGRSFH